MCAAPPQVTYPSVQEGGPPRDGRMRLRELRGDDEFIEVAVELLVIRLPEYTSQAHPRESLPHPLPLPHHPLPHPLVLPFPAPP
jgi:hypothetical protein